LSKSGCSLMPRYFLAMLNTLLQCNTTENINICFSITNINKHCKTNRIEGEWNGRQN
jgi:hypothetical protein